MSALAFVSTMSPVIGSLVPSPKVRLKSSMENTWLISDKVVSTGSTKHAKIINKHDYGANQ